MGGYADYALATKVPALWAQMQRDQAQKRTGDLAKNMFAQLQGLDPQSKEYFQKMSQLGMESGDDILYQTGEGLNKSQQDYVFDNPLYTSDIKEYILTTGDSELSNRSALDAFIQRSNRSKATNVSINNMPAPMTNPNLQDRFLTQQEIADYTGDEGAFGPFTKVSDAIRLNARSAKNAPTKDQQDSALTASAIDQSLGIMPNFPYPKDSNNPFSGVGLRTMAATATEDAFPQFSQIVMPGDVKEAKDVAESSLPWITKMITGADATADQKEQYRRQMIPQPLDRPATRTLKAMRLNQIAQISKLRAVERLPDLKIKNHSPGNLIVGQIRLPNGKDIDIVSNEQGMAYVDQNDRSKIIQIQAKGKTNDQAWSEFMSKLQNRNPR